MIVVCELFRNGVDGRKVRALREYLQEHVECRCVPNYKSFKMMCLSIRQYVDDLNTQYSKDAKIQFNEQFPEQFGKGTLRFFRPGSSTSFITLTVLSVRDYEKGGSDGL